MSDFSIKNLPIEVPQKEIPRIEHQEEAELREAARQFEALFTNMVMQQMRETIPDSEVFGDSSKTKFFESMLYEEYSELSSKVNGNGLADMIYRQLSRNLSTDMNKIVQVGTPGEVKE